MQQAKPLIPIAVFLTVACGFSAARTHAIPSVPAEDDEYAVYSAAIRVMNPEPKVKLLDARLGVFVIEDLSQLHSYDMDYLQRTLKDWIESKIGLAPSTVDDFWRQNARPKQLRPQFDISNRYALVSPADLKAIFSQPSCRDSWASFNSRYPHAAGLTRLSAVGFDAEHRQALVLIALTCGSLCGSADCLFLVKDNNYWSLVRKESIWVS